MSEGLEPLFIRIFSLLMQGMRTFFNLVLNKFYFFLFSVASSRRIATCTVLINWAVEEDIDCPIQ